MEIKKRFAVAVSLVLFSVIPFAFGQKKSSGASDALASDSFVQGLLCYRDKAWTDAAVFLRQAAECEEYSMDSTWYMIIMSLVYSENFSSAVNDCDYFISLYPESRLLPSVEYQRGRALHSAGQNDRAVMALASFCNEYPDSGMYSSALYWIAECFYEDYDYETARSLYERIVSDFPESTKRSDAEFKLYLITQRDREQKLLYLLKMTGEEYLSSRENYERELRTMQSEDLAELKKQLRIANSRIKELEGNVSAPSPSFSAVRAEFSEPDISAFSGNVENEEMYSLKEKAALIQKLLDEKYGGK
ncbi:tetratricopeptide repeat protein [Treponema sp.]|uniref:tetratricopeptide repeat protein n=1 Tax=Treponema sp. TaxID=166 RepID=UPI003F0FE1DC